jgi:hypothetical protein
LNLATWHSAYAYWVTSDKYWAFRANCFFWTNSNKKILKNERNQYVIKQTFQIQESSIRILGLLPTRANIQNLKHTQILGQIWKLVWFSGQNLNTGPVFKWSKTKWQAKWTKIQTVKPFVNQTKKVWFSDVYCIQMSGF